MGSQLDIINLTKSFQGKTVLNNLNLTLREGEFVSLLGPSGCGKTTTLNLIAGFFQPDSGEIRLAGNSITTLPTHRRGVSMVFQNYALFPHMTIIENIGFGLKMRGEAPAMISQRVEEMLNLVQLTGVASRYPRQLSGGQQQRVGLARALAPRPGLMVLDEPMSNLDAKLRRQMQLELREILKAVGTTTLYVTHDQEEALAMSDRMVVMYGGRVEQAGTPSEVYHSPRTRFVAGFVGESNFVVGKVIKCTGERAEVQITPNWKVSANTHGERIAVGDEITLVVRPEDIQLQTKPVSGIPGVVSAMAFGGASLRLRIDVEGIPPLACEESSSLENELKIGSQVEIIIDDDAWISMPDRDAQ